MYHYLYRTSCAVAILFSSSITASPATASIYLFSGTSADGHAVSGSADFALGAGTVTVKLVNATTTTHDAGELFTGIDFSFGGLVPTLSTDTGIQRTVNGDGSFSDTGSVQNLSWSLVSVGSGSYQLNFNSDAEDSIIGPPSGGNYSGANGSIKDNNGHNPFAAQLVTVVLNVPGLNSSSPVSLSTFRYGTELLPATGTITSTPETTAAIAPEPTAAMVWGGISMASMAVGYGRRSRARTALPS